MKKIKIKNLNWWLVTLLIQRTQISHSSGIMSRESVMESKGFQVLSNFLREPLRENLNLSSFRLELPSIFHKMVAAPASS